MSPTICHRELNLIVCQMWIMQKSHLIKKVNIEQYINEKNPTKEKQKELYTGVCLYLMLVGLNIEEGMSNSLVYLLFWPI